MALIFAIIIIPITLVLSIYVGYQIKTVTEKTTYDARIMSATKDAIEAFELNTFGDLTSDNAISTRRNVLASVNTFITSLSANFGTTGYDNTDILAYVPALLVTMYDGYYIYAPNSENKTEDNLNEYILNQDRKFIIAKKSIISNYKYNDIFTRISYNSIENSA